MWLAHNNTLLGTTLFLLLISLFLLFAVLFARSLLPYSPLLFFFLSPTFSFFFLILYLFTLYISVFVSLAFFLIFSLSFPLIFFRPTKEATYNLLDPTTHSSYIFIVPFLSYLSFFSSSLSFLISYLFSSTTHSRSNLLVLARILSHNSVLKWSPPGV